MTGKILNKYTNSIIVFSFIMVLLAHGALRTVFPSIIINAAALVLVTMLIIQNYVFSKNDLYGLFLCLYICAHFDLISNYGGFFVLSSFLIFAFVLFRKDKFRRLALSDKVFNVLIIILVGSNLIGWLTLLDASLFNKVLGIVAFMGYILAFYMIKTMRISLFQISILLRVIIFMQIFELLVALNTYIGVVKLGVLAFFPTASRFGSWFTEGTFNHSELFGEISLLSILFLIPFLGTSRINFRIKKTYIMIGIITALMNLFLSGSRSTFILLFVGLALFYLVVMIWYSPYFKFEKSIRYTGIAIMFVAIFWGPLNLGYVLARFNTNTKTGITGDLSNINLVTGEGTPREHAFMYFFERYQQRQSWWTGYGYSIPPVNRDSWFVNPEVIRADYHSLYLSVIILYGWLGSLAYIMLFIITMKRLIQSIKPVLMRPWLRYYFYPLIAFIFLFIFFMLNEYKTSALRIPHYHLLTWFWLGLANATYYSIQKKLKNESLLAGSLSR